MAGCGPAVFGAMDGLVTNIALIAGVGGGGVSPRTIVLTGTAGLVAGAISMGLGEFTSVRAQNEQIAAEVAKERRELERNPEEEAAELARIWQGRGLPADLAMQVARRGAATSTRRCGSMRRRSSASTRTTRPARGRRPVSSFVCFSIGALVPLLPYLLGGTSLWPALAAGGVGLFVAGALISRFTRRRWWAQRLAAAAARGGGGRGDVSGRQAHRGVGAGRPVSVSDLPSGKVMVFPDGRAHETVVVNDAAASSDRPKRCGACRSPLVRTLVA